MRSLQSAVKYAFWISHDMTWRPLRAAMVRAILTESLDTTDEYVIVADVSVMCPPATRRAFRLKFSPNFISKIIWHRMNWCPFGISSFVPSNSSNAGLTFFISLQLASHYRVSPLALSSLTASSTDFGI